MSAEPWRATTPLLRTGRYQIRQRDHAALDGLRKDIANRGITLPLVVDQDFYIVDGHHRYQIARELGFRPDEIPIVQIVYADLNAAQAEAVFLNHLRDNLTAAEADQAIREMGATELTVADLIPKPMTVNERREAVVQMRARGMSLRAIAAELGVNEATVKRDLDSTVADATVEQPDVITGRDGKKRKARKDPVPEPVKEQWGRDGEVDARRRAVHRLAEQGATFGTICRDLNLPPHVVSNDQQWLRAHGHLPEVVPVTQQLETIRDLAEKGNTSRQIAAALNVGPEHIRNLCHSNGIDIPADRIVRGRPEANKAMTNTVQMLAEVVESFERVNIAALDVGQAEKWSCSLTESAKQIQALRKRINQLQKEQDQ